MLDSLEDVGATTDHVALPIERKVQVFATAAIYLSTHAAEQHSACCIDPAWVVLVPAVDKGARCGHVC